MLLEIPLHCLSFWFSSSWLNLPVPLCMQILRWLFWPFEHFSRRRRWFLVHISSHAPWKLLTAVSLSLLSRLAVTIVFPKSLPTLSVPTLDFQRHSVCRLHQAVPEWKKPIVIDAKIVWGAINNLWLDPWLLTTLQSRMNTKLIQHRFWQCYDGGLIKMIQTMPHNP